MRQNNRRIRQFSDLRRKWSGYCSFIYLDTGRQNPSFLITPDLSMTHSMMSSTDRALLLSRITDTLFLILNVKVDFYSTIDFAQKFCFYNWGKFNFWIWERLIHLLVTPEYFLFLLFISESSLKCKADIVCFIFLRLLYAYFTELEICHSKIAVVSLFATFSSQIRLFIFLCVSKQKRFQRESKITRGKSK